MYNIFISYNRQSQAIVRNLAEDISTLGHTAWFDQDLSGGQVWWDQILAMVRACDVFVFVLAPEALDSMACRREYAYAADLGKAILPVLVAEGVSTNLLPPALSRLQIVDYRQQDRSAAFRLARALTAIPPPKPLPDPLPVPPEVPISHLVSLAEQIETTSPLSYQAQSALVFDLKRSLRDPETTDDAHTLLEKLRRRRDLFAAIADEIDELLASARKSWAVDAHTVEPRPGEPFPRAPNVEKPFQPEKQISQEGERPLVGSMAVEGKPLEGARTHRAAAKPAPAPSERTQKEWSSPDSPRSSFLKALGSSKPPVWSRYLLGIIVLLSIVLALAVADKGNYQLVHMLLWGLFILGPLMSLTWWVLLSRYRLDRSDLYGLATWSLGLTYALGYGTDPEDFINLWFVFYFGLPGVLLAASSVVTLRVWFKTLSARACDELPKKGVS